MVLTISNTTQRRFILGKQGLFPGRRWQGKKGTAQAIASGSVVQVDPLNMVARNHDIVLYGRVQDYRPSFLNDLLYTDRAVFDWGGTVMIRLTEELPYWRVVMARKQREARRVKFAAEHSETIDSVMTTIKEQGPLGSRDFKDTASKQTTFRSGKLTSQALYYLWIAGELMTHSRRGFDRIYDVRDRIVPDRLNYSASPDEADDYFALKVFQHMGMLTARGWRNRFAGTIARKVNKAESAERLEALLNREMIAKIHIENNKENPQYVLTDDIPLIESLQTGSVPTDWQMFESATVDEVVFLGPLDIVSARGRALSLFDFEYVWEVYKPQQKRRWGYYTMPILYGDRLVARMDPKFDRESRTLYINGFWLEGNGNVDDRFISALSSGFKRFLSFLGAKTIAQSHKVPPLVNSSIAEQFANRDNPTR